MTSYLGSIAAQAESKMDTRASQNKGVTDDCERNDSVLTTSGSANQAHTPETALQSKNEN